MTTAIPPAVQQLIDARQTATKQEVAYAVAAKQLDAARQQGQAAVDLVEAARLNITPGSGTKLDLLG